jgi:hypothetical protein
MPVKVGGRGFKPVVNPAGRIFFFQQLTNIVFWVGRTFLVAFSTVVTLEPQIPIASVFEVRRCLPKKQEQLSSTSSALNYNLSKALHPSLKAFKIPPLVNATDKKSGRQTTRGDESQALQLEFF